MDYRVQFKCGYRIKYVYRHIATRCFKIIELDNDKNCVPNLIAVLLYFILSVKLNRTFLIKRSLHHFYISCKLNKVISFLRHTNITASQCNMYFLYIWIELHFSKKPLKIFFSLSFCLQFILVLHILALRMFYQSKNFYHDMKIIVKTTVICLKNTSSV